MGNRAAEPGCRCEFGVKVDGVMVARRLGVGGDALLRHCSCENRGGALGHVAPSLAAGREHDCAGARGELLTTTRFVGVAINIEVQRNQCHARPVRDVGNEGLTYRPRAHVNRAPYADLLRGMEGTKRKRDVLQENAERKRRHDGRRNEFHAIFILRQGGLNGVEEVDDSLTAEIKRGRGEFLPGVNGFKPYAGVRLRR